MSTSGFHTWIVRAHSPDDARNVAFAHGTKGDNGDVSGKELGYEAASVGGWHVEELISEGDREIINLFS